MNNDFLWVEKYRPKTIEECILPDNIKTTFQSFLDRGEVPNLLQSKLRRMWKNHNCKSVMQRTRSRLLCHQRIR